MCSCSLFFFTAAHFPLGGHLHLSFSHRRYKIFMFFFKRNWSQLIFISRAYDKVDIKIQSKERFAFVDVFSLYTSGRFSSRQEKRGLPMAQKRDFPPIKGVSNSHSGSFQTPTPSPPTPPESVRTGGRTLTSQPNFLGWIDSQIVLTMGYRYKIFLFPGQ